MKKMLKILGVSLLIGGMSLGAILYTNTNNLSATAKTETLQIRLNMENIETFNIQEEETHGLNADFFNYLTTIEEIDVVTPKKYEQIAVTKDNENYSPLQEIEVDVSGDNEKFEKQIVTAFVPTNYLFRFNQKQFEKNGTLLQGRYPSSQKDILEMMITDTYQAATQTTIGDIITVFTLTQKGLVEKEVVVSGIYHANDTFINYPATDSLDVFFMEEKATHDFNFFSDIIYDTIEVQVAPKDAQKVIQKIKTFGGIREEILVIEHL